MACPANTNRGWTRRIQEHLRRVTRTNTDMQKLYVETDLKHFTLVYKIKVIIVNGTIIYFYLHLSARCVLYFHIFVPDVLTYYTCIVRQLKCCGVMGPSDWKKSEWYKSTGNKKNENFPESCCVTMTDKCSAGANPDIYQKVSTTALIA